MRIIIIVLFIMACAPAGFTQQRGDHHGDSAGTRRRDGGLDALDLRMPAGQPDTGHGPREGAAADVAERFAQRFADTLDFGLVYREFFVTKPERRQLVLASFSLPGLSRHARARLNLDPALIEEAYIASSNFHFLKDLYELSTLPPEKMWRAGRQGSPGVVEDEIRITAEMKSRVAQLERLPPAKRSEAMVKIWTQFFNRNASLYRRLMPPRPLDTAACQENLRALYRTLRVTRDDPGLGKFDARADLLTDGEVTAVVRGPFSLLVKREEDGGLRIYHANRLTMAPLFYNLKVRP